MQNFIKTIINAVQSWTKKEIKNEISNIPIVEPDWNENDSSSENYIKNRPFYSEQIDNIILDTQFTLSEREYTFSVDAGNGIIYGEQYTIYFDGVKHNGIVNDYDGYYQINASDESFYIGSWYDNSIDFYSNNVSAGTHTIKVVHNYQFVKQIDEKYLKVTTNDIQDIQDNKMNKRNPVGTGGFSMNRKSGTASGNYSTAMGYNTTASGYYSTAMGYNTQATTNTSATVTTYNGTYAGYAAHAEGYGTVASGAVSHAEGNGTRASGDYTHAEGYGTVASGAVSHAEGNGTRASGDYTHAEGKFNTTYILKLNDTKECIFLESMSEYTYSSEYTFDAQTGVVSLVNAKTSTISGISVFPVFLRSRGQWYKVFGDYKDGTINTFTAAKLDIVFPAHIVGNGTSDTARSNAHTLDWDGNAWYAGDVYVGSTSGTNKDDGSKKLATEEYVDDLIGGSPVSEQIANAMTNAIPVPTGATVGQILAVKAVDENGKPTEWGTVTISLATDENGVIGIVVT